MKYGLILLILLSAWSLRAQDNKLSEEKRNEFEAQKVAFFTQALSLTPQEAVVFWPLYNEMGQKIREKECQLWKTARDGRSAKDLTEARARKMVEEALKTEQEMLNIKKEYYHKFLEILPAQKVSKLDWVEHKFHKQLLDKMRKCSGPQK